MMDNVLLVDFENLFVLAVGLSMAYIVFEEKREFSFFSILSRITETLKSWVLDKKTKPQQKEESVIAKIDYYLNSGLLKESTKGALDLVSRKAKDVVQSVHDLEEWSSEKIKFHTKTKFLSVISYDCFLFGIFVLFVGVFQNKSQVCVDGLLGVMLFAMSILLLHCLVFEHLELKKKWERIIRPSMVFHTILLLIALWTGIACKESFWLPVDSGVLPVCCAVMCFSGFLAYLAMNILANIVLAIIVLYKISSLKISVKAKGHEDDMARYQDELAEIDRQLGKEKLGQSISVVATDVCTEG